MICPNCNTSLSFKKNKCDSCGENLRRYKRVISASNKFYNDGLTKAKIRDLSGAVVSLTKSLEFNKKNTNARNLLGLVYLEMGETVSALSEWVISKHFQSEENDADNYIEQLQANPSKLESLNQTIKKYNSALQAARQGNEDLAILQLKKVTSLNPKFLCAHQLLALLYIHAGEKEKALRCLQRARKIDLNNTTTLHYLTELGATEDSSGKSNTKKSTNEPRQKKVRKGDENVSFMPSTSYKEDKPNILAWCNLVIGAIIGIAVVYYLMVPTIEKKAMSNYQGQVVIHNEELTGKEATISALEGDKSNLEKKVKKLTKENETLKEEVAMADETKFDDLFLASRRYIQGKTIEVAELLLTIDMDKLERPEAINLMKALRTKTYSKASNILYEEGYDLYDAYKYEEAIPYFEKAVQLKKDNVNAIYFLGRSYHRKDEKEKAAECYNTIINDYPDSDKAKKAKQYLNSLGV